MGNKAFVIGLFNLLNANYNYAVLRSFGELPEHFSSHDIDILVDKKEFNNLKKELYKIIKGFNYQLLMVNTNERFITFIIAKQIEGELEYLYLDFFFLFTYRFCSTQQFLVLRGLHSAHQPTLTFYIRFSC